jgi:hypothetical protein
MKLNTDLRVGRDVQSPTFLSRLYEAWRQLTNVVNDLTEGKPVQGVVAMPVIAATQGTFIQNAAPTVLGSAGSRYVVTGWVCTVGGDPATFVEARCLTGT